MRCKHHSCLWYHNSRLYFAHRPFSPYPVQLPRGSFAKESKQNGTAAEAFCVGAAAALIRRRFNGAAAEFAALTAALAPAAAQPRAAPHGPRDILPQNFCLPAPMGNSLCHALRKTSWLAKVKAMQHLMADPV